MSESTVQIIVGMVVAAIGLGVVLIPVLRPRHAARAAGPGDGIVERRVAEYREAMRAGTICERCLAASPPGSRFCGSCGRRLSPARQNSLK